MANPTLLILAGDGIGPEVMGQVTRIIDWFGAKRDLAFDVEHDLVGGCAYDKPGTPLHDDTMKRALEVDAVLLGVMPGCYSVVLIALNNLRDRTTDQRVNKKTLAVRFGEKFARIEILFFLFVPSIVPLFILQFHGGGWLCAMAAFLSALRVGGPLVRLRDPRVINDLLPHAGTSSLFLAILVSLFLLM